jgi:hypothetical protein
MGKWLNKHDNWIGRGDPINTDPVVPEQPPVDVKEQVFQVIQYKKIVVEHKELACPYPDCQAESGLRCYGADKPLLKYYKCLTCGRDFIVKIVKVSKKIQNF